MQRFKKWRTSRWRELKKVAYAQHRPVRWVSKCAHTFTSIQLGNSASAFCRKKNRSNLSLQSISLQHSEKMLYGAKYLTHYKAHCQKFQNSNNSNRSEFKGTQLFSIQKKQIFVINKCTVLKKPVNSNITIFQYVIKICKNSKEF